MKSKKEHLAVMAVVFVVVIVIIVFSLIPGETMPPEYDLGDESLIITSDKVVYENAEAVNVSVENTHNETLYIGVGGCDGKAFGISQYQNGKWADIPPGCGFCDAMPVMLYLKPHEAKVFTWNKKVYVDAMASCKEAIASPGWYRFTMRAPYSNLSYSPPFQII